MKKFNWLIFLILITTISISAQQHDAPLWNPNVNDSIYRNPIIYADYSDPDAIRVGDDFYMVSSSFTCVPGLPILHSKDLVNWTIIGYGLQRLVPEDVFNKPQQGKGVWAPCIRFHKGEFYIYYPDPDYGIYQIKAKDPAGPWSAPILVEKGKGLIDPSPLWDDDGKVYLVHAFAGSRASIKSLLVVCELDSTGTKVISQDKVVFDGHDKYPTLEGPKFYKRNGFYYIFAPAGGVPHGWQVVLRSKNVYGPYHGRTVLAQGNTNINGPHQGAWLQLKNGENWFIHFQEKEPYGRIVHLQPMVWKNNWPIIGVDRNNDGIGEPVLQFKKPDVGARQHLAVPQTSDEFNTNKLGLQWQWMGNPKFYWAIPMKEKGVLRMYSVPLPDNFVNFYEDVPNILAQKLSAPTFTATAKIKFTPRNDGEKAGLIMIGRDYAYLSVNYENNKFYASQTTCINADKNGKESETKSIPLKSGAFFLRLIMNADNTCTFSISENGEKYTQVGNVFHVREGGWMGAKMGLFIVRKTFTHDAGNIDVDWFRVEK